MQIVDRDWGLVAVESNEQAVTRKILDRICGKIRNGWIGRRVPVLFRECGLQEVRVEALGHVGRRDPVREMHELVERQAKALLGKDVGERDLALV